MTDLVACYCHSKKSRSCQTIGHKQKRGFTNQLVQKFKNDKVFKDEYSHFINKMISDGHAELVPKDDDTCRGKVWYTPHFSVAHPQKNKLRIVFDASARFGGISLNETLLQGPDHINLRGILLRFRKEKVALLRDIEKMFYNFKVPEQHRDYLRFLWVDESMSQVREYGMTVHLFVASSSPGVAAFALSKIANDYRETKPAASDFILQDFYVDDGIASVQSKEEAIKLVKEATEICNSANLRLHKFICSDRDEVLATIPQSERN